MKPSKKKDTTSKHRMQTIDIESALMLDAIGSLLDSHEGADLMTGRLGYGYIPPRNMLDHISNTYTEAKGSFARIPVSRTKDLSMLLDIRGTGNTNALMMLAAHEPIILVFATSRMADEAYKIFKHKYPASKGLHNSVFIGASDISRLRGMRLPIVFDNSVLQLFDKHAKTIEQITKLDSHEFNNLENLILALDESDDKDRLLECFLNIKPIINSINSAL